jgi:GT2 family glycosyltransferase
VPDVEISIVNDNSRELLRRCLLTLPAAAAPLDWRASVVDNVSVDGSREMVAREFPAVRLVANRQRRGFSANHNQVLRRVVGERSSRYVLVLNDDTELAESAVVRMVAVMDADPHLGAVVPEVVDGAGRTAATRLAYPTLRRSLRYDLTGVGEPEDEEGWLQGCCLLLRVAALADVGLFDERFFLFYEDVDLSRRLTAAGWTLGTCARAVVVHTGHASVLRSDMTLFTPMQGLHSRYLYFAKHLGTSRSTAISWAARGALAARAARLGLRAQRRHDRDSAATSRHYLALARYDPRRPPPLPARAPSTGPA